MRRCHVCGPEIMRPVLRGSEVWFQCLRCDDAMEAHVGPTTMRTAPSAQDAHHMDPQTLKVRLVVMASPPSSVQKIAADINASVAATTPILELLHCWGWVDQSEGLYRLSKAASTLLRG